jgi:hypothetical protein
MAFGFDIREELIRERDRSRKGGDFVLDEVHRILAESSFKDKHILDNLKQYNHSFGLLDEESLDPNLIFKEAEIKKQCIGFRLKFLDSRHYKPEIPYEAILKIRHLNEVQKKDLQHFKVLGKSAGFKVAGNFPFLLFAQTVYGRYYLVHAWGHKLKWYQKISAFPLRNFETLLLTVLLMAFITTMSLPTTLITLDREATYWCGYRIATFFHLFIFYSGITTYLLVGFNKSFSSTVWKNEKEFD